MRPAVARRASVSALASALDTPWFPAAVLLLAAAALVLLRLAVVAHGHISFFVLLGSDYVIPSRAPAGVYVFHGSGYDGQFYYRLALAPWDLARTGHGVILDTPLRAQRIGYPFLAWLTAAGQARLVPVTLVVVNVVALGLAGLFSGQWARSFGRHAGWGLLPAGYFGLVWSLSRDLTEVTSVALMIGGIVAWRSSRFVLAGLALAGAVLCRETALVVVAALVVTRVVEVVRRRSCPGLVDAAWALPVAAFAGWEVITRAASGRFALAADHGASAIPFDGVIRAGVSWLEHPHRSQLIQCVQMAALVVVIVLAFWHWRRSRSSSFEKLSFLFAVILIVFLSTSVWNNDPREFRTMVEAFVLGSGLLLGTPGFRPRLVTAMTWCVWGLVAAVAVTSS